GDARDFSGERGELVHHRVDGVLEFENFAFDVYRDFLGQVAVGNGGGDCGDVTHLGGEVGRHEIDGVGQVFPSARDTFDFSLTAEYSYGADFASHPSHFGGKRAELVDHAVDRFGCAEEFAFQRAALDFQSHGLREISFADCADHARCFANRMYQARDQG